MHSLSWRKSFQLLALLSCFHCVVDYPDAAPGMQYSLLIAGTRIPVPQIAPNETSGLKLWFKADSITAADGTPQATWSDQSGLGNDAFNPTPAQQPLYRADALNGNPALEFDGVDDSLQSVDVDYSTITIMAVARFTYPYPGSDYRMCLLSKHLNFPDFSTALYFNWNTDGSSSVTMRNSLDGQNEFFVGTPANKDQWYIVSATYDGSRSMIYMDGVQKSASSQQPGSIHNNTATFYIGRNANTLPHRFGGDIAEILMYDRALSSDERKGVECNLALKYGLTVTQNCVP